MTNFDEILKRIKNETEVENMIQLSKEVGTAQSYVSKKRKDNEFPVEWAYVIAQKYKLSTDWIMTGIGPIRPDQPSGELEIIAQIEKWISETEKKQPGALSWFKFDFRKKYPDFDKWEKREEDSLPGNISAG